MVFWTRRTPLFHGVQMNLLEALIAAFGGFYQRPVNPVRPVIRYSL